MLIVEYKDRHCLPCHNEPCQPNLVITFADVGPIRPWEERLNPHHPLANLYRGLHLIEWQVMAHVFFIHHPTQLQITSLPSKLNENGIPLVTENGRSVVEYLWGCTQGAASPHGFPKFPTNGDDTPEYWQKVIEKELVAARETRKNEAKAALKTARVLRRSAQRFAYYVPHNTASS